jgi:hypothetical protein
LVLKGGSSFIALSRPIAAIVARNSRMEELLRWVSHRGIPAGNGLVSVS